MVYGMLKLINFAHGDVYMLGAMTGYYAARALGVAGAAVARSGSLRDAARGDGWSAALLGALIERFAYRPLRARRRA